MDDRTLNTLGSDRIASRQMDELIGLAKGIAADDAINQAEVRFLEKWLVANYDISAQPLVHVLYERVRIVLADDILSDDEGIDLLNTLNSLSRRDFEIGEGLKPTTLPLDNPEPDLIFTGKRYCFTGTFQYGQRKYCEQAVIDRGGECCSVNKKTDVLVIGAYATESWKHSSFGNKILQACEWRDNGMPIAIVCEQHWTKYL